MNWPLLQNSLLLAASVAALAVLFGTIVALWAQSLSHRAAFNITACAAIALALPPFLVANTWMHFFGLNGVWRTFIPLDLYSWPGAVLLMTLLIWPVSFFLIRAALSRLDTERLEADPLLKGPRLLRYVIFPHLTNALTVSLLLSFVLALNHFTIPALLQTKVFSADVWVQFNTTFDYIAAVKIGWPLIIAPLLLLLAIRNNIELWSARNPVQSSRFSHALGAPLRSATAAASIALLLTTVAFPLTHLASNANGWRQLAPAFAAGKSAFAASLVTSLAAATLAATFAILLPKRRFTAAAWLPFLIPGVILGIVIIRLFNQPALSWIYPTMTLVVAALAVRYLALPLQAITQARRSIDPNIIAAARADGASPARAFGKIELPLLATPIFFAWYIAYLFCLWDAETLVMIVPPGGETLSLRVFNMLHYGHTEHVNALCLWLIFLALAPLALRQLATFCSNLWNTFCSNRRKEVVIFSAAFLLTGCSETPENATQLKSQLFAHVEIIGKRGNGAGEFNKPRSVAVDADDNLYVADMTGRIQKFSPDGRYLLSWIMPITDKGKPKGMIQNSDGNVIIVEPHYFRLNYHRPDGSLASQWGARGTNAGQLAFPRSVAVNSAGEVYVSEYGLVERVQRFSPGGANLLSVIGNGTFRRAEGIGIDSHDRLFVADSCNHKIQIFSREGALLRTHGQPGAAIGDLSYPYDVRVDRAGFEYVCEFGNSRVQIFDSESKPIEILGGAGAEPSQMNNPWAICLDSKGNLYVADSANHRVQKFIRKHPLTNASYGRAPQAGPGGGA